MSRVVEVPGRVLVFRLIAATYVPTNQAFPEMYPCVPGPEALLAAPGGGDNAFSYLISVCTLLSPEHGNLASYLSRLGQVLGSQSVAYRPGAGERGPEP